ncbi:MAG: hypothetical protein JXA21_27905 [Anaerolineae bacterium]|nr:hypothetical protein [Anaerolineae bacterium]
MKIVRMLTLIGMLAIFTLSASGVRSQEAGPLAPNAPAAVVAAAISYQGRLVDPGTGVPLSGTYDLEFTFWSLSEVGSQVGPVLSRNAQPITNGLYGTQLAVDPADFNGQELWLQIRVRPAGGTWETLSPRVQVLPTAYALSLRPGAQIQGTPTAWDGWVLNVNMEGTYPVASAIRGTAATGVAVRGDSTGGYGVYGYTESGYAVVGHDASNTAVRGFGGYFTSEDNTGVYGEGRVNGAYVQSTAGVGLDAHTGRADHNYGMYTSDNLYSLNYHLMGAVMQVVQNGGKEALEPGDVVAFSGMAAPLEKNGPPVIQVAGVTSANSTAVAGVVYSRFNIQAVTGELHPTADAAEVTLDGPVPSGEYLLLVVQGPVQVKAGATNGAIRPGDLLSPGKPAGYAGKAAMVSVEGVKMALPGSVFGKALEPLDAGQKLIYVYVTLQ